MTKCHKVLVPTTIVIIAVVSAARVGGPKASLPNSRTDKPKEVVESATHAHRRVSTTAIYWDLLKGVVQGLIWRRKPRLKDYRAPSSDWATQRALNTLRKATELAEEISTGHNKLNKKLLADFAESVEQGAEILRAATRQLTTTPISSYVTSAGGAELAKELTPCNANETNTGVQVEDYEMNVYLSNLFL